MLHEQPEFPQGLQSDLLRSFLPSQCLCTPGGHSETRGCAGREIGKWVLVKRVMGTQGQGKQFDFNS